MTIDGRWIASQELMRALQAALRQRNECKDDQEVEVIVADKAEAARVKAFLKMSGLQVRTLREDGKWTLHGSGNGCCCG